MTTLCDAPEQPVTGSEQRSAPRRWPAVLSIAVPTALLGLHALAYGRWIVDDAAITFAYARSVATGHGFVLQPGADPVEGFSNPAWLALLVIAHRLGVFDHGAWFGVPDYVAFPKLLALLCVAGMFGCYYAVARVATARPALATMVAGVATAAVPSFVVWTMSGLENALLALAVAGIAAVLARAAAAGRVLTFGPAVQVGLLAALAALTRPDGLVYAAAYPLAALLFGGRPEGGGRIGRTLATAAVATAAFAVPAGAYLGWRLATFGEYLPNTARAKGQDLPDLADLARPAELVDHLGWFTVVAVTLLVGMALGRLPSAPPLAAVLVPLGLAVVAYTALEPDWMGLYRFATPVWALGALAGGVATIGVWPRLAARGRVAVAGLMAGAVASTAVLFVPSAADFRNAPTVPLCLVAQNVGRGFASYAEMIGRPDATLLAPDLGGAALTSPLRLIDLAGLADARIAGFWHDRDWAGLRDYVFDDVRPTFIKGHPPWTTATGLVTDKRMTSDYTPIGKVSGTTTEWVRRDALAGPGDLRRLRDHFDSVTAPADAAARRAPRGSCGDRLLAG